MKHRFFSFPPKKKRRKKNASERRREKKDQIVFIGTYFTHYFEKKKKETHTHKHYYNVREIGRTSHRDRFGYHVLVRRRVVSTNSRLFFSVLESPDASSSIDFVVGRRFLRLMMMMMFWNARRETLIDAPAEDERKRGRRSADAFFVFSRRGRRSPHIARMSSVVYVERQSPDVSIIRPKPAEDERKEASESFFFYAFFFRVSHVDFFSRHFVMMI